MTAPQTELIDETGRVVFRGTQFPPGGGSQPGALTQATLAFQETAGAGTYTATLTFTSAARVTSFLGIPLAGPWDADSSSVAAGDVAEPTGYVDGSPGDAADLSLQVPYDPTAADNDVNYINPGTQGGAYNNGEAFKYGIAGSAPGVFYVPGDTLTVTVTTLGAGGTTGHTQFLIGGYGVPTGTVNAVKT